MLTWMVHNEMSMSMQWLNRMHVLVITHTRTHTIGYWATFPPMASANKNTLNCNFSYSETKVETVYSTYFINLSLIYSMQPSKLAGWSNFLSCRSRLRVSYSSAITPSLNFVHHRTLIMVERIDSSRGWFELNGFDPRSCKTYLNQTTQRTF